MSGFNIDEFAPIHSNPEDDYELLELLGEGSYGEVYKGRNKNTGKIVAVKIVPTSGEIESLKREIKILKECDSPFIVKYYGSYFKENYLWLIMEYCAAGSMIDLIRITKKILSETEIASVLQATLKGLNYLHENKKIHRDIKAANILLDHEGNAKLADFGVSAQLLNTLADIDTVIGTPFWMSPEVISKSKYNKKTDIWSLGITAIELAEGEPPYSHIHPIRAMFAIQKHPPQGLTCPSKWSSDFNDFVTKCLTVDPKKRPTAKELLQDNFIVKKAKGRAILNELVMNSMESIENYRHNIAKQDKSEGPGTGIKNLSGIPQSDTMMKVMSFDSKSGEDDVENVVYNESGTMIQKNSKPKLKESDPVHSLSYDYYLNNDLGTIVYKDDSPSKKSDQDNEEEPYTGTIVVKKDVELAKETDFVKFAKEHQGNFEDNSQYFNNHFKEKKENFLLNQLEQNNGNSKNFLSEVKGLSPDVIETRIQKLKRDMEIEIEVIRDRYMERIKKYEQALQTLKNEAHPTPQSSKALPASQLTQSTQATAQHQHPSKEHQDKIKNTTTNQERLALNGPTSAGQQNVNAINRKPSESLQDNYPSHMGKNLIENQRPITPVGGSEHERATHFSQSNASSAQAQQQAAQNKAAAAAPGQIGSKNSQPTNQLQQNQMTGAAAWQASSAASQYHNVSNPGSASTQIQQQQQAYQTSSTQQQYLGGLKAGNAGAQVQSQQISQNTGLMGGGQGMQSGITPAKKQEILKNMPFQFIPQEGLYAKELLKEEERKKQESKLKEQQYYEKSDKYDLSINPNSVYSNPPRDNYSKTPNASSTPNTQLKDKSNITNKAPDNPGAINNSYNQSNNLGVNKANANNSQAQASRKNLPFEFTPKVGGGNPAPSSGAGTKNAAASGYLSGVNGSFGNHFLSNSNSANNLGLHTNKGEEAAKANTKTPRVNEAALISNQSKTKYEENYESLYKNQESLGRVYDGQYYLNNNLVNQYGGKIDEPKQKGAGASSYQPTFSGWSNANSSSPNLLSGASTTTTSRTKPEENVRAQNADEFAIKHNAAFLFQPSHALKK